MKGTQTAVKLTASIWISMQFCHFHHYYIKSEIQTQS